MYQYHGWLSSDTLVNSEEIQEAISEINFPYPASASYVNGEMHISFSGNPNRNLGHLDSLLLYLVGLKINLSGCIYINDSDSDRFDSFDIIKVVVDSVIRTNDKNFTLDECKKIFT